MRSFTVAAVQCSPKYGEIDANLRSLEELITEASDDAGNKKPDLFLFPELSVSGFVIDKTIADIAQPVPGPATRSLMRTASRHKVTLCAGLVEIDRGLHYNTMVLVNPEGVIGKYRKVHMPYVEYPWFTSGGTFPVFDAGFCTIGIATCCDNLFPEQARILAVQGAEVILSPFCWLYEEESSEPITLSGTPDLVQVKAWVKNHLCRILPSRAYENGVYIVVANQFGWIGNTGFFASGGAVVFGPDGKIVSEDSTTELKSEIITADLDSGIQKEWRSRGNFSLKLRRPELYEMLIERR
jgi:predicted amidohydrolase